MTNKKIIGIIVSISLVIASWLYAKQTIVLYTPKKLSQIDKKYGDSLLMAKIGERSYEEEIGKSVCLPMDFTGRPMKGYVFVTPDGFDLDSDLEYWIQKALNYNREMYSKK